MRMELSFEDAVLIGNGHTPQAIHDRNNRFMVIYLKDDDCVYGLAAYPEMGDFTSLNFKNKRRISVDTDVSKMSFKKLAHFGGYGFWSAEGDHRFVVYMLESDISDLLIDGDVKYSVGSEISSLSASFQNKNGKLLNRNRAYLTPGTMLAVSFSLSDSKEMAIGSFYIDRASVKYPDEEIKVSARNAIGKLLKEQTFDENCEFTAGTLRDKLLSILDYAGAESYFVGDTESTAKLEFEPDTTLLEGIEYAISLLSGWVIRETAAGKIGIAPAQDTRFDCPSVFSFERDKTSFGYETEFDDSDAASRVCVYSEGEEESDPAIRVYADADLNKWWQQPSHRTKFVKTVNGATRAQVTAIAQALAESLNNSGRTETFACIFTPQLTIGDEVHMTDTDGSTKVIGAVTDISHEFGRSGFNTSFTVDSGGRKGKPRLKDLIDTAASDPDAFKGVKKATADGDEEEY